MNKLSHIAETAENYFDATVLETTDTIFQEIIKAIPVASSSIAIYKIFRSFNEKQKLKNILEFIQEGENLAAGSLLKIFRNQNNLEIGSELLHALDKTYLIHQSKMLARLALLYDLNEIDRLKFLRYAHIIPQFTSFLLEGLEKAYLSFENNKSKKDYHLKNDECNFSASELEKFGFLYVVATFGSGNNYGRSKDLKFFYENIYKNRHDEIL